MRQYCHLLIIQKLATRWADFSSRLPCTMSTFRTQRQRLGSRGLHSTPPPSSSSSGNTPPLTISWENMGVVAAAATAIGGTLLTMSQLKKEVVVPAQEAFKQMSFSLAKARPIFLDEVGPSSDYVSRPSIEKKVLDVFDKTYLKSGTYFVMYGPKGAGKSSVVARVLGDKTGVAKISISQGDTTSSILTEICKMCGQETIESPRLDDFRAVLIDAAEKNGGRPVTFVFEVERGSSSPEVLSLVKHVAKSFALNANVLIVLSEANAVLGFGDDQRQKFIWVNEMTRAEAEEFVKRRVPSFSTEDFNRLADKIGTLPLSLTMLCDAVLAGQKVDDFIRSALALAEADLVAFLHKPILAALKNSPEGVSVKFFDGVEHKEVPLSSPKLVAPAMKITNAIIYDFEKVQYKLFSKAHQTALKTYDPPSPSQM